MNPLAVQIAGLALESPLVLASGVLGTTAASLRRVAQAGAGAVTTKSCSLAARPGHPAPCVLPWPGGLINAVGLSNPGVEAELEELAEYRRTCATPLFVSIFAGSADEFGRLARRVAAAKPDLIEVNVSCPNVESEFGAPFAADPEACGRVTRAVKENAGAVPVSIKLSAQCASLARMAVVCRQNGADALTAINTVGPGMWIDVGTGWPALSNRVGGVSCAEDTLQLIMAGADAVGVGSGIYAGGIELFDEINRDLAAFLKESGFESLAQVRGLAQREGRL